MNNNSRYVFVPKPEVADWIDDNVDSWTSFCYENIYYKQRNDYFKKYEKISHRLFLILFGMICIALMYTSFNLFIYISFLILGVFNILLGFGSIIWGLRKNGR